MITQKHSGSTDGTSPEHGALVRCKYGLLVPEEPAGNPATAGPQGIRDNPEDTTGKGKTDRKEMVAGGWNIQRAPLVRVQPEDKEEEQGPLERQPNLNACSLHP